MFILKNKTFFPFVCTVILSFALHLAFAQNHIPGFERNAYYAALSSNELPAVEKQLDIILRSKPGQKEAFEGALQMKRAALIKGAANKLKEFKAGREKLENMIAKDPDNVEFRFLRLIIQEKAPKMLHYDQEINKDHQFIIAHFTAIPESLQKAIRAYSRLSNVLLPGDL